MITLPLLRHLDPELLNIVVKHEQLAQLMTSSVVHPLVVRHRLASRMNARSD